MVAQLGKFTKKKSMNCTLKMAGFVVCEFYLNKVILKSENQFDEMFTFVLFFSFLTTKLKYFHHRNFRKCKGTVKRTNACDVPGIASFSHTDMHASSF